MKKLLEYILKSILESKDFSIEEETENESINFTVALPKELMGLVIGKKGKTVRAIRNLLKIRATLEGKSVWLSVSERVLS